MRVDFENEKGQHSNSVRAQLPIVSHEFNACPEAREQKDVMVGIQKTISRTYLNSQGTFFHGWNSWSREFDVIRLQRGWEGYSPGICSTGDDVWRRARWIMILGVSYLQAICDRVKQLKAQDYRTAGKNRERAKEKRWGMRSGNGGSREHANQGCQWNKWTCMLLSLLINILINRIVCLTPCHFLLFIYDSRHTSVDWRDDGSVFSERYIRP